MSNTGG